MVGFRNVRNLRSVLMKLEAFMDLINFMWMVLVVKYVKSIV